MFIQANFAQKLEADIVVFDFFFDGRIKFWRFLNLIELFSGESFFDISYFNRNKLNAWHTF